MYIKEVNFIFNISGYKIFNYTDLTSQVTNRVSNGNWNKYNVVPLAPSVID